MSILRVARRLTSERDKKMLLFGPTRTRRTKEEWLEARFKAIRNKARSKLIALPQTRPVARLNANLDRVSFYKLRVSLTSAVISPLK
jgi:hypothetical protein